MTTINVKSDNQTESHLNMEDDEKLFIETIGCIETIIVSDEFHQIQQQFLENNYAEFIDEEENRLVYTDIFHQYINNVEKHIENELKKMIPNFNMTHFEKSLETTVEDLDMEIIEMLRTFWDFNVFKEMFLEYKKMKEGQSIDFSQDIHIKNYGYANSDL